MHPYNVTCVTTVHIEHNKSSAETKRLVTFLCKLMLSFCVDYFLFQPVLHDWCNKDRGMCYPICGMVHIKEPLLLIGKSSPCGSSGFPPHYLSGPLPYV